VVDTVGLGDRARAQPTDRPALVVACHGRNLP
jgi:hypothetical protein